MNKVNDLSAFFCSGNIGVLISRRKNFVTAVSAATGNWHFPG